MNWVEITDTVEADMIYKEIIKLAPHEAHNSLHVWEDHYLMFGIKYRVFTVISQPDYWTLEVLK